MTPSVDAQVLDLMFTLLCSGGNSPNTQPTTPFTLGNMIGSSSTSGDIRINGALDIYNHPIYYLTMAAYNTSSASIPTLQNASLIAVNVIVDDADNHGPTFDTSIVPSPYCAGIGKQVNRGTAINMVL